MIGINKANELIQRCLDNKAPIRRGDVRRSNETEEKVSIGH